MFDLELKDEDWSPIKFMGRTITYLTNAQLKQTIINHLLQNFNIRMNCTNKYFRIYDHAIDFDTLMNHKHKILVNTNSNINLIALVRFNKKPTCLYIDKTKNEIYRLHLQFSNSLYDGTIFEGETIDNYFLISDFLIYKNEDLAAFVLDKRLNLLKSIISNNHYHPDLILDPFKVIVKDFVEYAEMESFISNYIPQLPYKNKISGIIFRPLNNSNKNLIYNFPKDNRKINHNKKIINQDTPLITSTYLPTQQTVIHQVRPTMLNSSLLTIIKPKLNKTTNNEQNNSIISKVPSYVSYDKFQIDTDKHKEVKFLLFETGNPDDYILKIKLPNGNLMDQGYALVNDLRTSQFFQKALKDMPISDKKNGVCVACTYNTTFKRWKLNKLLSDEKPHCASQLI